MKENILSYTTRIGKTTFIVNVKQSESAKKPLNTVFQEICRHEMLGDFSADKYLNLENLQNHLDKLVPEGTGYRAKTGFASFLISSSFKGGGNYFLGGRERGENRGGGLGKGGGRRTDKGRGGGGRGRGYFL